MDREGFPHAQARRSRRSRPSAAPTESPLPGWRAASIRLCFIKTCSTFSFSASEKTARPSAEEHAVWVYRLLLLRGKQNPGILQGFLYYYIKFSPNQDFDLCFAECRLNFCIFHGSALFKTFCTKVFASFLKISEKISPDSGFRPCLLRSKCYTKGNNPMRGSRKNPME